jgi:hypothetical protein
MMKEKKAIEIKLALLEDVKILRKAYEGIWDRPAQDVVVEPSGMIPEIFTPGRKCGHGVYIPANSMDPSRAEYCTLCNPYFLLVKKHGVYVA